MQHNQTVRRRLQNGKGYLYLAPSLIILLVFTIYPLIKAFMMSFCEDYSIINGSFKGVNLQNYQDLFADDVFLKALSNTSIYVVFVVPVSILLSLVIAVLIHNAARGKAIFQTLYFLPYVTSVIAIGIIINNPEFADVRSLEGVAPTKKHAVFTIAVPTTAGTAAEVTINYVITDVEKKRKFVCVDTNDIPEIAVVDPDMMSSMPKGLTAATGMDALTHAIEGYITKGHCVISDMFHLEAIKLISQSLRGAVQNTPEGREGMALGQYIAGMGFSNVGLGIVHSMAHGLSALYDTPHGVACAILLPVGLEYNKSVAGERYRAVGKAMGVKGIDEMNDAQAADATIAAVKQLSADVGIPANLHGILKEEDIQFLAESAYADACRPGNPRDTSVEEIVELYKSQL